MPVLAYARLDIHIHAARAWQVSPIIGHTLAG